jgi:hypothetical protein
VSDEFCPNRRRTGRVLRLQHGDSRVGLLQHCFYRRAAPTTPQWTLTRAADQPQAGRAGDAPLRRAGLRLRRRMRTTVADPAAAEAPDLIGRPSPARSYNSIRRHPRPHVQDQGPGPGATVRSRGMLVDSEAPSGYGRARPPDTKGACARVVARCPAPIAADRSAPAHRGSVYADDESARNTGGSVGLGAAEGDTS